MTLTKSYSELEAQVNRSLVAEPRSAADVAKLLAPLLGLKRRNSEQVESAAKFAGYAQALSQLPTDMLKLAVHRATATPGDGWMPSAPELLALVEPEMADRRRAKARLGQATRRAELIKAEREEWSQIEKDRAEVEKGFNELLKGLQSRIDERQKSESSED